jgi:hypothetical protein
MAHARWSLSDGSMPDESRTRRLSAALQLEQFVRLMDDQKCEQSEVY